MNLSRIEIKTDKKTAYIPNRWEMLSKKQFLFLVALLAQYAAKSITASDLKLFYVCNMLGIDPGKVKELEGVENLIIISEQIDFIFDKEGKPNICYLAQLIPSLRIRMHWEKGYSVNTSYDTLTCSLTTAQFIDAWELLKSKSNKLPLLASILYSKLPYSSQAAHNQVRKFESVHPIVLQAISLNFQAVVNYLFTKTHFSLLSSGTKNNIPEISTGMLETMYNLSADGMGDVHSVKQMPIVEFLSILRKKIIDSVQAMHKSKIDLLKISEATGLDSTIIKKML
ncbi:MAG: hypothetical protein PHV66_00275 [Bacteroidales bacterium]|nr:hypothetical protein [Bacteroidales bacterium]